MSDCSGHRWSAGSTRQDWLATHLVLQRLSLQLSPCVGESLAQSVHLDDILTVLATAAEVLLIQ